ncbi:MAG TPA: PhaM family polyhydroxyalkanoate granule multifunctional regulatory protein [Bordetella sp.]|nr:PhaM family polyhydroxyalkanoate granule multifunctional regulatory protein [Bordetella sp.]
MTDHTSNPFVLPGMGQGSGDTATNPLLASMEMMRQAWTGLTGPGGLAQVMPLTPPMNLQDLERRIAELRSVESWLRMNLSMLSSTIQGLEVQRSTIATLRSFVDSMGTLAQDPANWSGASPLEIVLGLKPAPGQPAAAPAGAARDAWPGANARSDADTRSGAEASASAEARLAGQDAERDARTGTERSEDIGKPSSGASTGGQDAPAGASSAGSAQAISQAAQSASEAWWSMLQQQFNQLATATAATMPGMPGGPASPGSTQGATAGNTGSGPDSARGSATAAKAGGTASAKAGTAKKASASSPPATPRKTAVKKNKIQSDPDLS